MNIKSILNDYGIIPFNQVSSNDIQMVKEKMFDFASQDKYKEAEALRLAKIRLEKIKKFQKNKRHV